MLTEFQTVSGIDKYCTLLNLIHSTIKAFSIQGMQKLNRLIALLTYNYKST